MTWVWVDTLDGDQLPVEAGHHVGRVLRARPGTPLTLFDGRGHTVRCRVVQARKSAVEVERVGAIESVPRQPGTLIARLSLLKGERMDWALQKLTELGVDRIEIVCAERSVARWSADRAEGRRKRWQDIARSAAAQSERPWLPAIVTPEQSPATEAVTDFLLVSRDGGPSLAQAGVSAGDAVRFSVGPEGGFTEDERAAQLAAGARSCSLGPGILRAETAALVAATLLAAALGRI